MIITIVRLNAFVTVAFSAVDVVGGRRVCLSITFRLWATTHGRGGQKIQLLRHSMLPLKRWRPTHGDTTYVLGGHYYLNGSGLALTNANSNTTITAYPGTNPVISGGTAIPASSWSVGADGIWTAQLSSNDIGQLTVDGQRQTLARFPKAAPDDPIQSGWLWAQSLPDGGNPLRQLAYNPADFPIGQNPTVGQQATVFDANNWSNNVLKIAAVDTTSHVITFDGAATYYIGPGSRYFISGSKPLLEQPGEWYFDHATGILYFNPPSGFNGAGAVVSGNLNLIDISHAENITISGLTFSDAATNAQNEALINTAAVNVNASTGISITSNHFINVARGVHIGGNSNGNLVSNNDFSNIWAQSVSLARGTSHNRIVHNAIENSGDVFAAASAVQLDNTSNNIVSNNHILKRTALRHKRRPFRRLGPVRCECHRT